MILLALTCLLLGGVMGALLITRVDAALIEYIATRDKVLTAYGKKPQTFQPVIIDPDTAYTDEEKSERLRAMTGAGVDETL